MTFPYALDVPALLPAFLSSAYIHDTRAACDYSHGNRHLPTKTISAVRGGWLSVDFLCHSYIPFQKNGGQIFGSSMSVASAQGALSPIGLRGVAFRRVTFYRFVHSVRLSEGSDPAAYKRCGARYRS